MHAVMFCELPLKALLSQSRHIMPDGNFLAPANKGKHFCAQKTGERNQAVVGMCKVLACAHVQACAHAHSCMCTHTCKHTHTHQHTLVRAHARTKLHPQSASPAVTASTLLIIEVFLAWRCADIWLQH